MREKLEELRKIMESATAKEPQKDGAAAGITLSSCTVVIQLYPPPVDRTPTPRAV